MMISILEDSYKVLYSFYDDSKNIAEFIIFEYHESIDFIQLLTMTFSLFKWKNIINNFLNKYILRIMKVNLYLNKRWILIDIQEQIDLNAKFNEIINHMKNWYEIVINNKKFEFI